MIQFIAGCFVGAIVIAFAMALTTIGDDDRDRR